MSLAGEIAIGFRKFLSNDDIIENEENVELTNELKESLNNINERANKYQKGIENSVIIHASDRIITAPDIPVIGSIIGKLKIRKANALLEKARKEKEQEESALLNKDETVKAAVETNSFTNPNGANIVKTKAVEKGDRSYPRESGGEIRTRKGR